MSEVYLVTCGAYSDYAILAVFDDRPLAELFVARHNAEATGYNQSAIEVWELNADAEDLRTGYARYQVTMLKTGDVRCAFLVLKDAHDAFYDWGGELFQTTVRAKTKEQAIKVANERRTQHLALNTWGPCLK